MPRRKPTELDLEERKIRAVEWQNFRKRYLFTQQKLAEILDLSRRTVQMIEAGLITPHPGTLRSFETLRAKHEGERRK